MCQFFFQSRQYSYWVAQWRRLGHTLTGLQVRRLQSSRWVAFQRQFLVSFTFQTSNLKAAYTAIDCWMRNIRFVFPVWRFRPRNWIESSSHQYTQMLRFTMHTIRPDVLQLATAVYYSLRQPCNTISTRYMVRDVFRFIKTAPVLLLKGITRSSGCFRSKTDGSVETESRAWSNLFGLFGLQTAAAAEPGVHMIFWSLLPLSFAFSAFKKSPKTRIPRTLIGRWHSVNSSSSWKSSYFLILF